MQNRPTRMADKLMSTLNGQDYVPKNATRTNVLVVGLGFKAGQAALSNSPSKALAEHLTEHYHESVEYADPLVEQNAVPSIPRFDHERDWDVQHLRRYDAIAVAIAQPGLDLRLLIEVQGAGGRVEWFCSRPSAPVIEASVDNRIQEME